MEKDIREARYYNANGFGITIIACVSTWATATNVAGDWAAYIGADNGISEESCVEFTRDFGCKLSESDARHFFPEITLSYRR